MFIFYRFRTHEIELFRRAKSGPKTVRYDLDVWLRAEAIFPAVEEAKALQTDIKGIRVVDNYYLISNTFHGDGKRYTGIHRVKQQGEKLFIIPDSGVSMDEFEWEKLTETVFPKMKQVLDLKRLSTKRGSEGHDELEGRFGKIPKKRVHVKMFRPIWIQKDKIVRECAAEFGKDFAEVQGGKNKPIPGDDYDSELGEPKLIIDEIWCEVPNPRDHMKLLFMYLLDRQLQISVKSGCEACQIDSGSQKDHMEEGGCLDEGFDHARYLIAEIRKSINVNEMINIFDFTRSRIGATPMMSEQLGRAVYELVSDQDLIDSFNQKRPKPCFVSESLLPLYRIVDEVYKYVVEAK